MSNGTLRELNNVLFGELGRLTEDGLTGDALKEEISRAQAVSGIAGKVLDNASLTIEAYKLTLDDGVGSVLDDAARMALLGDGE